MNTERPLKALKDCEDALRKLAAESAEEGDYEMLERIGTTARAVSELAHEWQSRNSVLTAVRNELPSGVLGARSEPARSAVTTRLRVSRQYPKFIRRGDELVKIGWSKKEKREYQHRAGHAILDAISHALLDASKRRRLFTMEVLERQLGSGANAVPGYQTYVWLAWLRSVGLIKQHGRQGYSLTKPATFEKDVEQRLAAVPAQ